MNLKILVDRHLHRLNFEPMSGCWIWAGSMTRKGYGTVRVGTISTTAHRAFWLASGRELIPGLVLDHLCRNRSCVNPDHLRQVTHQVNILEGKSPTAQLSRSNVCKKGHSLPQPRQDGKKRRCRECAAEMEKARPKRIRVRRKS